ncbi:DUF642 domain-containing protein [Nostoc sp. FACHB-110]|uniref:DUF642 domain-containing protein n=1 Tax=Nostoc sp. FACHB-110 TaxID=2692834 RepID=UPI0016857D6C|nr:DUF642 domain-containing protein [Nostoc sp. FACHB-110]MBD2436540.1 DUF642 domain-containing protein [Nostoc sp. FACHB-110]
MSNNNFPGHKFFSQITASPKILFSQIGAAFTLGLLPLTLATKPATAVNLVTNSSFEEPVIPSGDFQFFSSIPGWSLLTGSPGPIEIQHNAAGKAYDGSQLVELDSRAVSGIFQDLTTEIGKKYQLQFAFSPRPGVSQNLLNINWGGTLVDSLSASGVGLSDTNWRLYTYELVATSTTTRLSFNNFGELSNSLGTYIDAISVTAAQVPEPTSVLGILTLAGLSTVSFAKKHKKSPAKA